MNNLNEFNNKSNQKLEIEKNEGQKLTSDCLLIEK
jgi:hypothetical protein